MKNGLFAAPRSKSTGWFETRNESRKKYTLKTLPNSPDMVGLEVLAYYYVTWAKVFPDQIDGLGLPYNYTNGEVDMSFPCGCAPFGIMAS